MILDFRFLGGRLRKLFVVGLFILFGNSIISAQQFPVNRHLKNLIDSGEYFQFHDELVQAFLTPLFHTKVGTISIEGEYFLSWDDFLFNNSEKSNVHIAYILKKWELCPDSITAELLQIHFQNDLRLFHYKTADSICNILLFRYSSVMSSGSIAEIKNAGQITSALKNIPPQTIERNGDLEIKYKRDIASLIRIPVSINGEKGKFIMDTGANLSTISESEAKRMGIKILDANFGVTSSSRSSVQSKLGVADIIAIGNATFRNVIFIVLPDKSLSFLGGLYKIKGIIGLPVIAQLGEIQMTKKNIFSPKTPTISELRNLGMNGNTPFANVNFYGQYHPYIFDTGAAMSILGGCFKTTYADSLKTFEKGKSKVGGAGGMQTISTLKITNLRYEFGSQKGILKRSTVQLEGNEAIFNSYYGIVGEDILMQWKTVIINFDQMFVLMK